MAEHEQPDNHKPGSLLRGLGIGGYRSFSTMTLLQPLTQVTLLAGRNNAGKSNVIRFLDRYLGATAPLRQAEDEPQGGGTPLEVAIEYSLEDNAFSDIDRRAMERTRKLLALPEFHPDGRADSFWVLRRQEPQNRSLRQGEQPLAKWVVSETWMNSMEESGRGSVDFTNLRRGLSNSFGGGPQENIRFIVDRYFPFAPPPVQVVHAFRRVAPSDTRDTSGAGLIETLAEHQIPGYNEQEKRRKFDAINRFVREVLEDQTVRLEVPVHQEYLQVHQGGTVLPLDALGTGIHQVVILAAAATLAEDTLICIEEPEVNLHPILQRKLVRYLADTTSNQYIIATHSAQMLDYEKSSVVHLRKTGSSTEAAPAVSAQDVADVCNDLGYRPSDILQANAVIWVEGPSDRIYVNHWLRLLHDEMPYVEGIHYSVMFYGGRLLSHLSGDDPDVEEFISLRRLNRQSMIVIDSDKTRPQGDKLNETKERVIAEFDHPEKPGHAWVTKARTIENLVPKALLGAAVSTVHPTYSHRPPRTKWDDPLYVTTQSGKRASPDKVRIAAHVVDSWSAPLEQELRGQVQRMSKFIEDAN